MHPRQLLLIAFVGLMVASAGCAGFGTDSPPDQNGNIDTEDVKETSNELDDTETTTVESIDSTEAEGEVQPMSSSPEDSGENLDTVTSTSSISDSDSPSSNDEDELSESGSDSEAADTGSTELSLNNDVGSDEPSSDSSSSDDSDTDSSSNSDSEADTDTIDDSGEEVDPDESNSDTTDADDSDAGDTDDPATSDSTGDEATDDAETYTLTVEADAPVTIERVSDGATTTRESSTGAVVFTVIEDQYYVSAEGYHTPLTAIDVTDDTTVTLQTDGTLTVAIVDADTGEPIEGAEISGMCDLWYSSGDAYIVGESNADGVIEAQTLAPTTCRYDTQVAADGYETASLGEINVPEDDGMTVELQPEE